MILQIIADEDEGAGKTKTKLQFTLSGVDVDKQQNVSHQFLLPCLYLVASNKTSRITLNRLIVRSG